MDVTFHHAVVSLKIYDTNGNKIGHIFKSDTDKLYTATLYEYGVQISNKKLKETKNLVREFLKLK